MSKHFRVWSKYGRITVKEWCPVEHSRFDDITISAILDQKGWRVSALVTTRSKDDAIMKAHTMWNDAGGGHLVAGDQAEKRGVQQ